MPGVDIDAEFVTITPPPGITDTSSTMDENQVTESFDEVENEIDPTGKPFKWNGVEFPGWAVGPHFVILNDRTFALAMDPAYVTMEMKTNWMQKYVPELVKLGKQVLEKLLKEKITQV